MSSLLFRSALRGGNTRSAQGVFALEVLEVTALFALGEGAPRSRLLRSHLRDGRGLEPVEEALEPPDDLRLRDEELGVARRVAVERDGQSVQLAAEIGRQDLAQLADRTPVDVAQLFARSLIERRATSFGEQLADHRPDPQELARIGDGNVSVRLRILLRAHATDHIAVERGRRIPSRLPIRGRLQAE